MLQRTVRSQLARVESSCSFATLPVSLNGKKRNLIGVNYPGPLKKTLRNVRNIIEMLSPDEKHWFAGGLRSVAVAIEFLQKKEIIAVPTDTVFGFAVLAQSNLAIDKLYALKGRDKQKPLAIAISSVPEIREWAEIDHLPFRLLTDLLPGPVTVVLKRKAKLNPALNPGCENVGIRVPPSNFIRHICKMVRQPLALTSANVSNQPSSLHPDEFKDLWPDLGAIFYNVPKREALEESNRVGSTVIDLTKPGQFKILRAGIRIRQDLNILKNYGVEQCESTADDSLRLQRKSVA